MGVVVVVEEGVVDQEAEGGVDDRPHLLICHFSCLCLLIIVINIVLSLKKAARFDVYIKDCVRGHNWTLFVLASNFRIDKRAAFCSWKCPRFDNRDHLDWEEVLEYHGSCYLYQTKLCLINIRQGFVCCPVYVCNSFHFVVTAIDVT